MACCSCHTAASADARPGKFPLTREAKVALLLHKITATPPPSCVCGKGPAVSYCTECEKGVFLCEGCWEYHEGYPLTRKHFSLVLNEAREQEVNLKQNLLPNDAKQCKLHPDQKLDFLCLDCATPLCSKCTQINERDHVPLSEAENQQLEQKRASIATALKEFPEKQAKLQEAVNNIAATKEEVKKRKNEVEAIVRNSFSQLRQHLVKRETTLLGKCEDIVSRKSFGLNIQQEEIQKLLIMLSDCQLLANNLEKAGEHHEMEFLSDLLAQVEPLLSKIKKMSLDPCENANIPFDVNTDELQASIATLGHVGVTASAVTSKIKVTLPARFCAGREEIVRVTVKGEEIGHGLKADLSKKGQAKSQAVVSTRREKDGSYLLFVKPQEEGEYLLSVTFCGQHVPNSPFLLPVNNRDYYRTTLKQPVQTINIVGPRYIAFSSNGNMFVTSSSTHSVHVYDRNGEKRIEIGKKGDGNLEFNYPNGIAIIGDVVYVADSSNHRIQKFSTGGNFLSMFGSRGSGNGEISYPQGLTIGPDGMVYVSDYGNNRIVVFSEIGIFTRSIDVSAIVKSPYGLAFSADGNFHVAGYDSNNYAVFTPAGKLVRSHGFSNSTVMAIDAAGFVFAVRNINEKNSLSIFDPRGQVIHTIGLDHPWGVAIASDGSVWVAGCSPEKLWKF